MYDLPGFNNEEEERKRLLAELVASGAGAPEQPALDMDFSADPMGVPQASPDLEPAQPQLTAPDFAALDPSQQQGGYRPPPAMAEPQYMNKVGGREFGVGDIAMLGGIVASLFSKRPDIAGTLGGQYAGALMQDSSNREHQNQQIDKYNTNLANEAGDSEFERWKADKQAQLEFGNMAARKLGLDQDAAREKRIAEHQAAVDDPESAVNKGALTQKERELALRKKFDIETAQGRSDIDINEADARAKLLQQGKYKQAVPAGKGGGGGLKLGPDGKPIPTNFRQWLDLEKLEGKDKPKSAADELKEKEAKARLAAIESGEFDPTTNKPIAKRKAPFAGFSEANPELWNETSGTASNYEKGRKSALSIANGIAGLSTMRRLIAEHGSQFGTDQASNEIIGEFNTAKSQAESAVGEMKQLGILQEGDVKRVEKALGATIEPGIIEKGMNALDRGDPRLGNLDGALKGFGDYQRRLGESYGLNVGGGTATKGGSGGGGGKRTVTMKNSKTGETATETLSEGAIQRALADGWELQ